MLDDKGYVFLKGVVKEDIINYTNGQINNYMKTEHIFTKINSKEDVKDDKYYVNNNFQNLNTFPKIQFFRTPVFNVCGKRDTVTNNGLLEVYNPERIMTFLDGTVDMKLVTTILKKLTGVQWKFSRMNLKFMNNVVKPQRVHVDDQETCIKFCIYLSHVNDINQGPNIYIEGSHKDEKAVHDRNKIKVFNGNKGDVLVSYQNGYHGKAPNPNTITAYLTLYFVPTNPRYTNFSNYMNRPK